METIIGALIALFGVVAVQLWVAWRESARWKREVARRFHDDRAKAYTDFLTAASRFASGIADWRLSSRDQIPPSVWMDSSDLDGLYDLLVPIKVFGTDEAAKLAEEVVNEVWRLGQDDGDSYSTYQVAEAKLIRQIRVDLDISPVQAPTDPPD
ncbi:hypothetical protein [Jiangella alba]|uniref:Uncharacterized protein n=1 Tax=Jiangella alba TaxID=561176 RepID=A0A1H5MPJ9_9ACTN|nr:hypothetical protein [Jiangella alba]SEE91163.1 hypothetical protein SAMN04488561_3316 [Jiangella alba]